MSTNFILGSSESESDASKGSAPSMSTLRESIEPHLHSSQRIDNVVASTRSQDAATDPVELVFATIAFSELSPFERFFDPD